MPHDDRIVAAYADGRDVRDIAVIVLAVLCVGGAAAGTLCRT